MGKKDSIGTFKCCSETKELTCYFCVSCKSIQHRSCIERKRTVIYLKDHWIYCSKKGEDLALQNVKDVELEIIINLREIVAEQQQEIGEKTRMIERIKRNSSTFENHVVEAEEHYKKEIENLLSKNQILEEQLKEEQAKLKNEQNESKSEIRYREEKYARDVTKKDASLRKLELKILEKSERQKQLEECNRILEERLRKETDTLKQELSETGEKLRREINTSRDLREQLDNEIIKNRTEQEIQRKNLKEQSSNAHKLQSENSKLGIQIRTLEDEINRLKKENRENACTSVISNNLKELEEKLRDESGKRKREKIAYLDDIDRYKEDTAALQNKIDRMNVHNENLKKDLENINTENKHLLEIIDQLPRTEPRTDSKPSVNQTKNDGRSNYSKRDEVETRTNIAKNKNSKPKAILLGGRNGYNYGKIFKAITENKYDTNCQYSESNLLEDILRNADKLTQNLTKNDCVILFTDGENARRGKSIKQEVLRNMQQVSKKTNLIVVGAPFIAHKLVLNDLITKQNDDIKKYFSSTNSPINFVECSCVIGKLEMPHTGIITSKGKWKILNYIYQHYIKTTTVATQTATNLEENSILRPNVPERETSSQEADIQKKKHDQQVNTNTNIEKGAIPKTHAPSKIVVLSNISLRDNKQNEDAQRIEKTQTNFRK